MFNIQKKKKVLNVTSLHTHTRICA